MLIKYIKTQTYFLTLGPVQRTCQTRCHGLVKTASEIAQCVTCFEVNEWFFESDFKYSFFVILNEGH